MRLKASTMSSLLLLFPLVLVSPASAETPSEVGVGMGFGKASVEVVAGKGGKEPAAIPTQVKHGTGGVQAAGEVTCPSYSDGEIIKSCWQPTPEDCFDQGLDTNAGVSRCPAAQPVAAAAPRQAPEQTARQFAIDYFRSLPLPVPRPTMSAPKGICGASHSLDLQVPQQSVFTDPETPFGSLVVHVHGTFDVDWGDGRKDRYTTAGGPWPTSRLTHTWEEVGHYDITVTANWSADWSYGSYSGSLAGLTTTNTLPAFPVIELQAVLVS